jgi:hypothetical protein
MAPKVADGEWIELPVAAAVAVSGRGVVIPVPPSFVDRFVFGAYVQVDHCDRCGGILELVAAILEFFA